MIGESILRSHRIIFSVSASSASAFERMRNRASDRTSASFVNMNVSCTLGDLKVKLPLCNLSEAQL